MKKKFRFEQVLFHLFFIFHLIGQVAKAPEVKEGDGPYTQLIIRGVTLINGNGAPPVGPMDIVIENNIIKRVANVGYPGVQIDSNSRPKLAPGGKEINANGMYACLLYTSRCV